MRVWPASIPYPEAISWWIREIIIDAFHVLEHDCGEALRLTPPELWHRLIIIDVIDITGPRVPRAVACTL